jgi:hypothetical protein
VGYCRQQANKYGIKGSRVAAARAALTWLAGLCEENLSHTKLGEFTADVRVMTDSNEHMAIVAIEQGAGTMIDHWDVCGRKLSFTASVKHAHDVMVKLVGEYGHRALQAERQEGVDWKALSHAVRVATQAIELLQTGSVTFPLPNAGHVLAIKTGEIPYREVAEEIELLLVEVEAAAQRSTLRDEPDREWIDNFVAQVYAREVKRES